MFQVVHVDGHDLLLPAEIGDEAARAKCNAKLAAALSSMDGVRKNAKNLGFTGAKYANIKAVIDGITEALDAQGLAQTMTTVSINAGLVKVAFYVSDSETGARILVGLSSTYVTYGKTGKEATDAQAVGSAETYAMRRGMLQVYSIPQEDDDGNAASGVVVGGGGGAAPRPAGAPPRPGAPRPPGR